MQEQDALFSCQRDHLRGRANGAKRKLCNLEDDATMEWCITGTKILWTIVQRIWQAHIVVATAVTTNLRTIHLHGVPRPKLDADIHFPRCIVNESRPA